MNTLKTDTTFRVKALKLVKSRPVIFVTSILLFFATYMAILGLYAVKGRFHSGWVVQSKLQIPRKIPFYLNLEKPGSGEISQKVEFNAEDYLAIPRVSGNQVTVYIDEQQIAQIGEGHGTGNIWMSFHWVRMPERYAGRPVVLKVKLNGVYDLGFRENPYIINGNESWIFRVITAFLFRDSFWLISGVFLVLAFLLFKYGSIQKQVRTGYWLTAIGILLSAFYQLDYTYREDTGSFEFYFMFRKLALIAGFSASWFILAGIELYLVHSMRWAKYMSALLIILVSALALCPDIFWLKKVTPVAALLAYSNWIGLLVIAYQKRRRLLIFSISFFLLCLLAALATTLFPRFHIFLLQIGSSFAIFAAGYSLSQQFRKLYDSAAIFREKSIHDPLTGAFNRYYLDEIPYDKGDSIILFDMDNFKGINDTHGHQAGDSVLRGWVKCVRQFTRENDPLVRIGGDEFILVLKYVRPGIMTDILSEFEEYFPGLAVSVSFGVAEIKTTIEKAIEEADAGMYRSKVDNRSDRTR